MDRLVITFCKEYQYIKKKFLNPVHSLFQINFELNVYTVYTWEWYGFNAFNMSVSTKQLDWISITKQDI